MRRKDEALAKNFSSFLDDDEKSDLVRAQLLELRDGTDVFETAAEEEFIIDLDAAEGPVRAEVATATTELEVEGDSPEIILEEFDESPEPAEVPETADAPDTPEANGTPETNEIPETDETPEILHIEDMQILNSFLQESRGHLENIEERILQLEQSESPELIDDIFRTMHSIKGTSSFFGLASIELLSHRLETLLVHMRKGKISISAALIDLLLEGSDSLSKMLNNVAVVASGYAETDGSVDIRLYGPDNSALFTRIDSAVREGAAGPDARKDSNNNVVTEETVELYMSESQELLSFAEESILGLEANPDDRRLVDSAFRAIHNIKGNAGFLGFSEHERLCSQLEDILQSLRSGDRPAGKNTISTILSIIDSLGEVMSGRVSMPDSDAGEAAHEEHLAEADTRRTLGELLVEMGEVAEADVAKALELQDRPVGEILIEEGKLSREALDKALELQSKAAGSGVRDVGKAQTKEIRVDVGKLDKMFDLMGELITAEAMVIGNPDLKGLDLSNFKGSASYLGKITRQMQEITMSVRMVTLEGLFNKAKRAARDLSRKFSKEICLVIEGQKTEMDRTVIEELSDPLVHIIRNALDHGIEDAKGRKAAGKPQKGTLSLGAKYEGSEVWITIRDDGNGLNREKIIAKAIERGMTTPELSESLEDDEVWNFIFEAGFSTADTVSEISGRGVGMDVVKQSIGKLKGKIEIASISGEGTEIKLKIPLTLSIIDGVTAKAGGILYALPLSDIREFHQATPEQIANTGVNLEVLRLRDEVIPIIRLHEFFNSLRQSDLDRDLVFLVVQRDNQRLALLVDEIVSYQQIVVKALPDYMGEMDGISGCSILGNGEIALIIDTSSLIKIWLGRDRA